jgi:hypothetical protein
VWLFAFKSYCNLLIVFISRQASYLRFAVTNVGRVNCEGKKKVVDGGGTSFKQGGTVGVLGFKKLFLKSLYIVVIAYCLCGDTVVHYVKSIFKF